MSSWLCSTESKKGVEPRAGLSVAVSELTSVQHTQQSFTIVY